jgi:two-component system cell cycle sensor histidine kinase/response regulator CckA
MRDNAIANTDKDKPAVRLLVVDDDSDTLLALKLNLLNYGFLVDAFTNSEEALQSFKSNAESYRLVMSDSGMPSLSGIQLANKVKEINPNVKVLLLTGFGLRDIEFSKPSPSTSVDDFIQKPISIKKLTDKILSLIGETKDRTSLQS